MMIMNWKNDPVKPINRKPTRFNLGGLIKKKITWRRSSIDLLASTLGNMQLDLSIRENHHGELSKNRISSLIPSSEQTQPLQKSSLESSTHGPDSLDACSTERLSAATSTTSYPLMKNYTHVYHTEERYTSFTTECISLLNSDMTLHMEFDTGDHDDDDDDDKDDNDSLLGSQGKSPDFSDTFIFDPNAEENIVDYRAGGYHPVKIGDWYDSGSSRYQILRKLGWGNFSTVWLCSEAGSGRFLALKIVKLGKNYAEAAKDEINILRGLQGNDLDEEDAEDSAGDSHVVKLLDHFDIRGVNGSHMAMVFELMGENMLNLMYKFKAAKYAARTLKGSVPLHLLRLDLVRLIAQQLLLLVDYMHRKGVVHTDLKPENILMTFDGTLCDSLRRNIRGSLRFQILPSQPLVSSLQDIETGALKVKVADLGNATYSNFHFTNYIQTRQYRAPEIILKHGNWGALADVWSIGCLLFELMTGDYLFDPHEGQTFTKDEDHLAQIIELLGEFPSEEYLAQCELAPVFFKRPDVMENIPTLKFWSLEKVLVEKYRYDFNDVNVKFACDVILKCLKFEMGERYDCGSLLAHPWFKENARFVQSEVDLLPNHNSEIRGFVCEE